MAGEEARIDYAAATLGGNRLTERAFQRIVIDHLVAENGYTERRAKTDFDPVMAMDAELLFAFLRRTQPDEMAKLDAIHGGDARPTILNRVNAKIASEGLIRAIWTGVDVGAVTLDLVCPRPAAPFDGKARALFAENELSVMEEVCHRDGERIDLGLFLNGLALFTAELKCNTSASGSYRNAIRQYREERDCTTRLLSPKVGALAHFAFDLNEVHVCAELKGRESVFLPFNQGQPDGEDPHAVRAGNPHNPDGINTAYLWEDIWTRDTVFDLLYDFVYVETVRDKRGKRTGERPVFPRYQQLRAVRRVAADVLEKNPLMLNYLVEHSAGSGKTKTISWLAHRLAGLYAPGTDALFYDKVIVVTDRKVVDGQLQNAVKDMAKDTGIVRVMDKGKTSADLGRAVRSGYRIIVTTIQKFLYLDPAAFDDAGRRYAVIIDEAHGSTSGKNMAAVNAALGAPPAPESSLDELARFLNAGIALSSRQRNVTLVGFTATPTGKTLQQFGRVNAAGVFEAFDLYSMRQAIEEGFILDVTANYATYEAYCRVVKAVADDPELESRAAKRKLARMVSVADGTIRGNLEVMAGHFASEVAPALGGAAKAMIVCAGREEAVRYYLAYERMRAADRERLGAYRALVAFTGDVRIDGLTYTEAGLNGFPEDDTAEEFDTDAYRILIVADKYQTGFDQDKLAAMYVDKRLGGIAAVQTLSRLNRVCRTCDGKRTFVLDFRNSFDDIREAFAPYYQTTFLADPLTLTDVRETEWRLAELDVLDMDGVEEYNRLLAKGRISAADKRRMWALLDESVRLVNAMGEAEADEARRIIRNFIRQYAFLLQATPLENRRMHMEYNFCLPLIRELDGGGGGAGFSLTDKVRLEDFEVEKTGEHRADPLAAEPEVRIAKGTGTGLSESQFERLSAIIAAWNARYGLGFDAGVAAGSLVSLRASLEGDDKVRRSAKVNAKRDFRNTVEDRTEDALLEGYGQNEEWYKFLLGNVEARRQLVHVIVDDLYGKLKGE